MSHPPPPVPGGVAPKFGSEKVSRYTGVSQLQLRVSRCTVQLSEALWRGKDILGVQSQEPLGAPFLKEGLFSRRFSRVKTAPIKAKSAKRPIEVGKRPIKERKRPINANGQFLDTPPWWKTAPLKRPIKRSMTIATTLNDWGYGIAMFRALNFKISEPEIWREKIALSAEFQGFSWKFRPLKNIFRTLENGHSIRHQSIPPLSAGRILGVQSQRLLTCARKSQLQKNRDTWCTELWTPQWGSAPHVSPLGPQMIMVCPPLNLPPPLVTLPALQKNFVNIFSCFPGIFALKNDGDFW